MELIGESSGCRSMIEVSDDKFCCLLTARQPSLICVLYDQYWFDKRDAIS